MTGTTGSSAGDTAWAEQRKWSTLADDAGSRLQAWRLVNLVLLVAGALLGVLAAQSTLLSEVWQIWVTLIGAVVLIVAGLIQKRQLGPDHVERHAVARAVSEAVKSEIYRYLAGVAPYAGPDRDAVLASAVPRIRTAAGVGPELDERFRQAQFDGKPLPAVTDIDSYVRERAVGQRDWHRERVATYERRARRLRIGELAATVIAALLTGATAVSTMLGLVTRPDVTAWVGLATTVGASFAAHLSATRLDKIASGYAHTADRLQDLLAARDPATATPDTDAVFVAQVEETLARQNESWISLLTA